MAPRRPRSPDAPVTPADQRSVEQRVETLEAELRDARGELQLAAVLAAATGLAQALADAGRHDAGIAILTDTASWARTVGADTLALRLVAEEAALEFDAGRLDHARARFELVHQLGRRGHHFGHTGTHVRFGLALEAEGRHREAIRHFGAALLEGTGPGEIESRSAFLLELAEERQGFAGAAYARAAREGFKIVADHERASRADALLRDRTRLTP